MRKLQTLFAVLLLVACGAFAQDRERANTPEQYKWNLTDLYPSDDAWRQAKDAFAPTIVSADKLKGTLGKSPQALLSALDTINAMDKTLSRLAVYASLSADQDTRDSKYQAMRQEVGKVGNDFGAAVSFVEPEILALPAGTVDSFLAKEPKLKVYDFYLHDLQRRHAHTGTEGEEKIIADAGLMAGGPGAVFGIFSDADFPYPSITLSDGKTYRLDGSGFNLARAVPNRADREKVMDAFFNALGKFRRTFGTTMNAKVQKDLFFMKASKYNTTLEATLDGPNIPVAVYTSLVDGVNANLPTFHRYLKLRQRILGLDQLHYYDLYAPLVESSAKQYSVEEAKTNIFSALAPLGPEYVSTLQRAFNEHWIDLYPNTGKRAGAYSQGGAYDVHPYMLINYNGKYGDVSTVAHELGHTMQSYFSNKNQPYVTAGYPTFVAEVASTFNEALLNDYMLKQMKDDASRLSLLGDYLENIKGTVFRQTQFAEFELRAHQMAEKGQPLTGDTLTKLYEDITRKYYGHDSKVCIVDDYVKYEWSYIPHFYRNYYVFQYATSFTASAALSEKVMAGDKAATKRYLDFLSAGGSKYPIELLKNAGVDMTTSEPLDLTMRKMNRVMDEMESILKKMGK
jgi:oligoendopeptidase F